MAQIIVTATTRLVVFMRARMTWRLAERPARRAAATSEPHIY
jgi:hypothetical protein